MVGIGRALVSNIKSGSLKEGGSTITQQLAKNLFLSRDKKISRKLEELILAIKLEGMYTKDEILEMYLNIIYYGSGAYGIGNASQVYFEKDVSELSLEECALLAGIPKAPSLYNPKADSEKAKKRQDTILNLMEQQGFIKLTTASH
jgi:penicillin-binding protein 1A/penicillin-binding protein 2A